MARNHVKVGHKITLTAPTGGVVSGNLYVIGSLVTIASYSAVEGEQFEAYTGQVWNLPKVAADDVTEGAPAYWDGTKLTVVATDNDRVGHFVKAAAVNATEAQVMICQLL